ncbi:Alpha/Beta hydrolase protein [Mycena rosella]|uniref:Protein phosphatase methylesterase 1 n=1 Tax=Mycena rosella TaxID=1033263 RepID=A0AAD7D628_MYCRO|nr:Alpha/Beta hydrolase protein [Mycena rosella]
MSDLYRSALSARLAKLPLDLPPTSEDEDDLDPEMDAEDGDALGVLPGSGLGPPAAPARAKRTPRAPNPDFAPISGADFFADALQVAVPARKLDCRVYYTPPKSADGTVLVCHHGAGYGALSFAALAREVVGVSRGACGVLAVDARRHGTKLTEEGEEDADLSIGVLVDDFVGALEAVFPDPGAAPTLLLVGHSMGGAVVVRACPRLLEGKYRVSGVAVLDVVEGSAIEALPHMHSLLNARPDGFDSPEDAIEWHFKTKTIRNSHSARVSVPSIIVPAPAGSAHAYTWRTPLRSTAPYWTSWFTGLSDAFLAARTARLLLLAGTDRLDRPLMIAQMQGKFQMVVAAGVGHMLHEDDPTHVAEILLDFWRRNDRVRLPFKGIKGVGEA